MIREMHSSLVGKRVEMLDLLQRLVSIDSGSFCKEGIDLCGAIVAEELQRIGFETEVLPNDDRGNALRVSRPGKGAARLLLLAHLDTVWPSGTVVRRPFAVKGNWAYGPGVADMKGGIVQMIFALDALGSLGGNAPPITVFCTGDEELGSVSARPLIEEAATGARWAIVMESAVSPEDVVVRRWGVGAFELEITGRCAHVLDPDAAGVNACSELAAKVLALEGLSDPSGGVRVGVNMVHGGTARQVTAGNARASIDVRVRHLAAMSGVESRVRETASRPSLAGIALRLTGAMTRPPMEPHRETEKLLTLAVSVARELGLELSPGEKAGGSDGSFASALGVATLDGMGPLCQGFCGEEERIEIASLASRSALLARIVHRLSAAF
ncbi:MAG: M20 family metallopeptidase [Spirochaetes bacterium]|nr:M20 family metallopeptidase [Spirochaetota bacterium]